jgi:hypothetical protein
VSESLNRKALATAGVVVLIALVVLWLPNNPLTKTGYKGKLEPGWPSGSQILANTPYGIALAAIGLIVVTGAVLYLIKGKDT